jgi:hypothetical protein
VAHVLSEHGIHHSRDRAALDEEKIGRTPWCARPRMNICAVNCKLSAEEQQGERSAFSQPGIRE